VEAVRVGLAGGALTIATDGTSIALRREETVGASPDRRAYLSV
jgi:Fe2+ transport system protein FeoA